ncbi:UDP-glucose 4-epimerase [hydrothermal vent metagenome]|uniref:UDP-glucose 4-epimerase n=1 Tax=hydrothermal vent metagenome TaxID=652676 RepID=A0A3B1AYN4_9ZZZZ
MRVLITGGAGYIGTELAYRLAERADVSEVIVYDNLSRGNYNLFIGVRKFPRDKVTFINGDLLDTRKLRKALNDIEVVYHLGAKVTKPFSDHNPHLLEQVNHWGTAEVVYAVEESNVSKLIYVSSSAVYGSSSEEVSVEMTPEPATYYGISKLRGEEHVARLQQKMPAYIVRTANVYGYSKSMRFDARINRFMFEAASGQKITVNGSGNQSRAYIHIDDTTDCLEAMLRADLKPDVYDLVTRNLTMHEVVDGVKLVFPETEILFINQHIKPWELRVKPDKRLLGYLNLDDSTFLEEIKEFKKQFTLDFHD